MGTTLEKQFSGTQWMWRMEGRSSNQTAWSSRKTGSYKPSKMHGRAQSLMETCKMPHCVELKECTSQENMGKQWKIKQQINERQY